jgi:hypothetical protein
MEKWLLMQTFYVTPGFLKNKTRLIICVSRKSTHMSEWKSIKTMFI